MPSFTLQVTSATAYLSPDARRETPQHQRPVKRHAMPDLKLHCNCPLEVSLYKMVADKCEEKANNISQRKTVLQTRLAKKSIKCLSKLTFIFKYFDFWKITTTLLAKVSEKPWETRALYKNKKVKESKAEEVRDLYLLCSKLNYFQNAVFRGEMRRRAGGTQHTTCLSGIS